MSEELLVKQCAPTLAGIKTGSLFPCPCDDRESLLADIRRLNRLLVPKGLCLLPIRYRDDHALLYLYRPRDLERDLQDRLATEILQHAGYACTGSEQCLMQLIERLRAYDEFPHEIGLFLSYPPEDVKVFIEHHAADFKYAGLWKVYGDEQRARDLFAKYQRCTEIYCQRLHAGSSIAQLAVNVQQRNTAQNERMLPSWKKQQSSIGAAPATPRPWPMPCSRA